MALLAAPGDPNGVMRDRIIRSIVAQSSGWPDPYGGALGAPNPYQDIVDPSDPASYNSSIVEAVNDFGPPSVFTTPGDIVEQSPPSTLEAPSPNQQVEGLPEPDPGDPDNIGTLEAANPTNQALQALEQQSVIADQNAANTGFDQGAAIAADVAGSLSAVNAAVNDAVSGYAADQGFGGFNSDPGGFTSDPGGFTSDPGGFGGDSSSGSSGSGGDGSK